VAEETPAAPTADDDNGSPSGEGTGPETEPSAQLDLLAAENRRLRREVRRARQQRTRRTAAGFALLGVLALAGAALFPDAREVLLALSGTGLFAAVLVYGLAPERFVAASVGEGVYEARATTGERLVAALALSDERVYVPTPEGVRLFVPQRPRGPVPDADELEGAFVTAEGRRGAVLHPTGEALRREFADVLVEEPAPRPGELATQVADALGNGFELVDAVDTEAEPGRLTLAVEGSAYGDVERFDHPVASFAAAAVADAVDVPVRVETAGPDERTDATVTVRWEPADGTDAEPDEEGGGDEAEETGGAETTDDEEADA
jgi:hypothetical protein